MRTTIDVPEELMRAAKVAAAERHMNLKELFTKALAHELGAQVPAQKQGRVKFPLVGSNRSSEKVDLTNEDIAEIFADEDAEKYA
ncbi:hypothetical protein [Nocardia miyunensis]|uniref:hypothetical protein n=1 Tax=Nocardia miyunensis TaxID=282684 RepID=UPI00082DBF02|nr:hypothetical protein [Nocardia miyunensis]